MIVDYRAKKQMNFDRVNGAEGWLDIGRHNWAFSINVLRAETILKNAYGRLTMSISSM